MQKHGNTRYHHGGNGVRLINNTYSGAIHDHAAKSDVIIPKNLMSPVAIYKQAQADQPVYFKNSNMPPVAQLMRDRVSPKPLHFELSPQRIHKLTLSTSKSRELSPPDEQLRESQMFRIGGNSSSVELLSPSKEKLQMKQDYLEYFDQINKAQCKYIHVMKYQKPHRNINELLKVYRDERNDTRESAAVAFNQFSTLNAMASEQVMAHSNLKKDESEGMKTSMTNLNSERVRELVEKNMQIKRERIRKEMDDAAADDDLRQPPKERSPLPSPPHETIQGPKFSPLSLKQKANLKKEQIQRDQMNSDLKVIIDEIKTERSSEKKIKKQKQQKHAQSGSPRLASPAEERRRLDTIDNPPSVLQESFAVEAQQTFQKLNQLDLNPNAKFTRTNLSLNSEENILTQDELRLLPDVVNEAMTLGKGAPFNTKPTSGLQLDHSVDDIEQVFLNYSNSNSQEKIEKYKQNIEYLKRHDTIIKDFVISKCPSILFEPQREIEIPRDNLGLTDNHYERIHNYQSKKRQKPQLHQKKFDIQLQPRQRNHLSASVNLNPKFMKDVMQQKSSTIAKNSRNVKLFKSLATDDVNLKVLRSLQGSVTSPKAYALRETRRLPVYGLKRSPEGESGLTIQVDGRDSRNNSQKFNSTGQSVFQANLANLSPRILAEVDAKSSPAVTIMSIKRAQADPGRFPHIPKHANNALSISLDEQNTMFNQMRQAAKFRQINHFNAPIPKLPTIFGPGTGVNYSSKLMVASTSSSTSPREQLSKQTEIVNKFLNDLIGNNKDHIRDGKDEMINGKPKKLKLFDNKRNKQIQIQSPKKMMETQISLNNSESLRQSLIQWNKNLVPQVDGTGIPISLYFKNQPNSKHGQRKMINIEQIRENSRDSEAKEKLYKEGAGSESKRERDEKLREGYEQDVTQTTELNKMHSGDRSDCGKDLDQTNPKREDEQKSAMVDQVRRPAVQSKVSMVHSKGSSFKVSMKEPNNANLPIMKQIIKLTKDQRAQNGVIQFNRKSELGDQSKKESLTLKDDLPHSNLGIWGSRQITKTGLSSHSVNKAPRQDNVSILQMNEHHLIRKPKNDLLAQNMTPWHNDNQAIAELLADEAASPNILDSKLGNRSIVRPMSQRSSGSSVKYTDQTVTSHADSKDRKLHLDQQAVGPSRLSQVSQGPPPKSNHPRAHAAKQAEPPMQTLGKQLPLNQQEQAAARPSKSNRRGVSKERTESLLADQTREMKRSIDQQNQTEHSQNSRKSGSKERSKSRVTSGRRQAAEAGDAAGQTISHLPYRKESGAPSSPRGTNRSPLSSTVGRDNILRQSRTNESKSTNKMHLKQIRVQTIDSRASAASELTPTQERNPLKALGGGSIATPSQEPDDAMTESRFDDELLDEVPDQIGLCKGKRPAHQQHMGVMEQKEGRKSNIQGQPGGLESASVSDADGEVQPGSGTQSVTNGSMDFRKAKLREAQRAKSVVLDFQVGGFQLDGQPDDEVLEARREMKARMEKLKGAQAPMTAGVRDRGAGSAVGLGQSSGTDSDSGQPGDSSGGQYAGELVSLDILEPAQPDAGGRQQSHRGITARLTKSLSVTVSGGGAGNANIETEAAEESQAGRRRNKVPPDFMVPRSKMSFADNKDEIDRFIKQLNKDVSQMPVGIQRYIASKEKEKEDTYTQVIQSQQKINEKLTNNRQEEAEDHRKSIRKSNLVGLSPQKSAPERKKQTVARTLSIFAGPKTKISQQLIIAQQQILDAFGDEKWGNDRKLTRPAAGSSSGSPSKRPPQARVSSLKTSIQSVLLGIREEDA